jgi:hypothetical protein
MKEKYAIEVVKQRFEVILLPLRMKLKPPLTNQKNGFDGKITRMIYTGKN